MRTQKLTKSHRSSVLSHGHFQNEVVEVNRHRRFTNPSPVRHDTANCSITGKPVITRQIGVSHSTGGPDAEILLSRGLCYRNLPRWRHRSFGQAGTTLWRRGMRTGRSHARKYPFFITTSIITTGMFTTNRGGLLFLLLA